jgi:hypothetical protein
MGVLACTFLSCRLPGTLFDGTPTDEEAGVTFGKWFELGGCKMNYLLFKKWKTFSVFYEVIETCVEICMRNHKHKVHETYRWKHCLDVLS